ncbi:MAG TPA: MerR family transcriptional regulator [Ignavibacteria bacterium]
MDINFPNNEPIFPIRTAAKLLNISIHTLRMYEKEGLIIPYKRSSKQRLYSKDDIERIECIRRTINEDKISINGIKTILSLIPCWQITGCNERKNGCSAFYEHSKPCWALKHENNYCTNRDCRECLVYKNYANCSTIKAEIRDLTHNLP